MGSELNRQAGRYWVLFYQPLPESGERIATALVLEDEPGRVRLEYDPKFKKVAKLYPDLDRRVLAFTLDSLREELDRSGQVESVLGSYGPQLAASGSRKIAAPVSQSAVAMLMSRYILPAPKLSPNPESPPQKVSREIQAFVHNHVAAGTKFEIDVDAKTILNRDVPGTKLVALAIPDSTGWTLIDGIDLNHSTVKNAVARTDEIARTFWNYRRAAGEENVNIRRVGIVLNGNSHREASAHEAHDYAIHRFDNDSDYTIDAASTESGQKLRDLLRKSQAE